MTNIVVADRHDIDTIVDLMREYSQYSPIKIHHSKHNELHVRQLLTYILLGQGRVFLGYKNQEVCGMLICIRQANVWDRELIMLQELAWYVKPEFRYSTIGYRLLSEYKKYATELLNNNRIVGYTLSKMSTSPELNYEKLGFELIESTYIGK